MEHDRLGADGPKVSRLGLGCWSMGKYGWGDVRDDESLAAIRTALDNGVTLFDTADVYGFGHSERLLAAGLGAARRDVVVSTKFGVTWTADGRTGRNCSPTYLDKALQASMERLQLDTIPLYFVHWPDAETPIEHTMRRLEEHRRDGLIEHIGLSNMPLEAIQRAATCARIAAIQLPINALLHRDFTDIIRFAIDERIGLLGYDILAKGLLTGKIGPDTTFPPSDQRSRDPEFQGSRLVRNLAQVAVLREIGGDYGKSPAQVAARWVLEQPGIPAALVGSRNSRQVEENLGALDWTLSAEDCKRIERAAMLGLARQTVD